MHHGLHLDPIGMPKRMRAEFTFSLKILPLRRGGLPMPEMVTPGDHCLSGASGSGGHPNAYHSKEAKSKTQMAIEVVKDMPMVNVLARS
jgi:hypothetical protein